MTRGEPLGGFAADHNRVQLGAGEQVWKHSVEAINQWRMFEMDWIRIMPRNAPVEVGTTVAVEVRHLGFWSLNAARIVYEVNQDGPVTRYGFAYGTLLDHAESGEERFTVEWNSTDDSVWYDLLAFSRPNALLAKLGKLLARRLQKRFAACSLRAMQMATRS